MHVPVDHEKLIRVERYVDSSKTMSLRTQNVTESTMRTFALFI